MATNSFGHLFRITTFGESHGKAVGVVIDGCPAGLSIHVDDIQAELALRSPGKNAYTSPRQEKDLVEIYSGLFEGKTTGAPVCLIIPNEDMKSSSYEPIKNLLRPGHANFTYQEKYGIFDYRGGGRASARETACRVAAGAIAKKLLRVYDIELCAYLESVGEIQTTPTNLSASHLKKLTLENPLFCPDKKASDKIITLLDTIKEQGDSIGGVVGFLADGLPVGLGDPIYNKLEATLAYAMLSIPASKGFEIGEGFKSAIQTGSAHNDLFNFVDGSIKTETNHAGGTLGGISTGMPLKGRVAFKPTSSIKQEQKTVTQDGKETILTLPEGSRHDPCVAIRAVPVVEAMLALVLADAVLMNRSTRLEL